jgi:hypothetical protein
MEGETLLMLREEEEGKLFLLLYSMAGGVCGILVICMDGVWSK